MVKGREIGAQVKTGGSSRSPAKYIQNIQNIQNIEGIWCGYIKNTNIRYKVKKWRRESSSRTVRTFKISAIKGEVYCKIYSECINVELEVYCIGYSENIWSRLKS